MTNPTITYRHGYLTDCDDDTGWNETVSGMTAPQASLTVESGDIFKLEGVCDDAGQEYVYYEKDITNISSDVYPKFMARWKTSASANGLGANIRLMFTVGNQWLLGASPQFSTDWTVTTGIIDSGKTIDTIRFYADDNPDATDSGTYQVYFDFLLLHKATFTFPAVQPGDVWFNPKKKIAQIPIPNRGGDIIQDLGLASPEITVRGSMLSGESWGTPDLQWFYYIIQGGDPWQWFTSDMVDCKVVLQDFKLGQVSDSGFQRDYELRFLMYSLSSLSESTWSLDQWFGK